MSANGYLEEDELALYALGLLSGTEASAVASRLSVDPQAKQRTADLRVLLGVYAEATVEMQTVPPASLDRLMHSITQEKSTLKMPASGYRSATIGSAMTGRPTVERSRAKALSAGTLPWLGWAIAAALLVASGLALVQTTRLRQTVTQQAQQVQGITEQAAGTARERDALRGELQMQTRQAQASRNEVESVKGEAAGLRARAADESARVQQESARAAGLAAAADQSARERDALKTTLDAQANQAAALTAQVSSARQIQDALTDATAMRVTLTVPKQKIAPSGRATYVAARGTLIFTASHLAPLREKKVYQLWLLPSDGSGPLPAGTFVPDASGNGTVVTTQFAKGSAKGFAVTIENEGGSQTPTLPLLLAGT